MLAVAGGEQANSPDSLMPPPHTNNSSTNQNNSLGRQDQQKSTTNTTSTTTAPTTTTTLTLKNGASCDSEKTNSSTASASQGKRTAGLTNQPADNRAVAHLHHTSDMAFIFNTLHRMNIFSNQSTRG